MNTQKNKRVPASKTHHEMLTEWLNQPDFKAEYDSLELEYQLLREMLRARKRAGLTQEDVAIRMGTKAPAVARLESTAREKHSPSINTLKKYAKAVGCTLEIHFRPLPDALKQTNPSDARGTIVRT